MPIAMGGALRADEPSAAVEEQPATPASAEAQEVKLTTGTKAFDAATVAELFEETKAENERRAEQLAPHINTDNLDIIELAPIEVDPYHIRNFDELLNKIDPQPRRRLQRLAELDPVAAADLQVSIRSEERFFAGEMDAINDDSGRTANVDFRTVGSSIADALARARSAMREKKATDNQSEIPTGSN